MREEASTLRFNIANLHLEFRYCTIFSFYIHYFYWVIATFDGIKKDHPGTSTPSDVTNQVSSEKIRSEF